MLVNAWGGLSRANPAPSTPRSRIADRRVTRESLESDTQKIAAVSQPGDFLAAQTANKTEPFAIARVVNAGVYITDASYDTWLGKMVSWQGAMTVVYEESEPVVPLMVDGIRVGPMADEHSGQVSNTLELEEKELPPLRLARSGKRYELSSDSRQHVMGKLLRDDDYVEQRANEYKQIEDSAAWTCKHCTYINVKAKKKCGVCSRTRSIEQAIVPEQSS